MPSDVFIEPKQEAEAARTEVKGWFERARLCGMSGINLYFEPYRKVFRRLSRRCLLHGYDISYVTFEGGLYRLDHGPGDCEEQLWYVGVIPRGKRG